MTKRIISITISIILTFLSLCFKIYDISVNSSYSVNTDNTKKTVELSKTRGNIYDRNLSPLTNNEKKYIALIKPTANALTKTKNLKNHEKIKQELKKGHLAITTVETADTLENSNDILTLTTYNRYEDTDFLCHILGYCKENEGVYGVEKYFNDILKKENGTLSVKYDCDALGRILNGEAVEINNKNYNKKSGLILTIDKEIQKITENALKNNNITMGCAIVLDVKTNEILAVASTPVFNRNNLQLSLNSSYSPFINRAFESFSVGSVFKIVTAASALENRKSDFLTTCNGKTEINKNTFFCNNRDGHGKMNLKDAIAVSCNPYFIELSINVGKKILLETAKNLGFGTANDFGNGYITQKGNLPTEEELNSDAAIGNLGFGQGALLATPLQVASCYSVIARNGTFIEPTLIKGYLNSNGNEEISSKPKEKQVLSEQTCNILKEYLFNTVNNGTGIAAKSKHFNSCGKTATAESGQIDKTGKEITHSWFVGFFPYENPKYVICIMKENGTSGSQDDAPVFKEISENIYFLNNSEIKVSKNF